MSINPKEKNLPADRAIELNSNVLTKVPLPDGRITLVDPIRVAIMELEFRVRALETKANSRKVIIDAYGGVDAYIR